MDYGQFRVVIEAVIDPTSSAFITASEKAKKRPQDMARELLLHEVSEPVAEYLNSQPEFEQGFQVMLDNGNSGFHSDGVALKLVDRALSDSPDAAICWLKRVLASKSAKGYVMSAIWGLNADSRIDLTDDVSIVPIADLPESPQKLQLTHRVWPIGSLGVSPGAFSELPKAALVRTVAIEPFL